ncbi:MAG TPA: preprotein translocase subunit SecE [Terracidiphilus sp.]|jgi:preprotein translocase subunit SecE|nr:preprotein translocase subunit SecE [Terracidiphilus sp.]
MATKTAIERGDERSAKRQEPGALQEFGGNAMGVWTNLTGFLSDVRAEMRKVVAPGWKEVRSTTSVVVITVFIFGVFFFVADWVFRHGIDYLLNRLGGTQ